LASQSCSPNFRSIGAADSQRGAATPWQEICPERLKGSMKLSVIIANYNYRDFVGAAIESALAVDWPDKEVIVVDDASSDDSKSIIEDFHGRVSAYFRPKSHQLGAHMFGFEQSSGEIIIFLDSDDLLEPDVMQEVAKVWRPGVSKVQYRMDLIDANGTQLGSALPQFPTKDDPEKLRRTFLRTMAYTTPPGSGNAYSRDFVRTVFAFGPTIPQSDAVLLTIAPLLGDVVTIRKSLARYRIHGASWGSMLDSLNASKLRQLLHQDIERAQLFATVSRQLQIPISRDPLQHSFHHLQYRLASYLVEPFAHPFPEDTKSSLVFRLMSSVATSSQMRLRNRAILLTWTIACALAPRYYRRNLILWRFSPISRPTAVRTLLGTLSSIRSTRLPDRA
jgi:glycosyltransferase involved in cell wall biosynthesis